MRGARPYVNTPTGIAAYHSSQLLVGRKAAKGNSFGRLATLLQGQ
jgi:hypothetical protein